MFKALFNPILKLFDNGAQLELDDDEKKQLHSKNMNKLKSIIQDFGWLIMGPVWIIRPKREYHTGMQHQTQKHRNSSKAVHIM